MENSKIEKNGVINKLLGNLFKPVFNVNLSDISGRYKIIDVYIFLNE